MQEGERSEDERREDDIDQLSLTVASLAHVKPTYTFFFSPYLLRALLCGTIHNTTDETTHNTTDETTRETTRQTPHERPHGRPHETTRDHTTRALLCPTDARPFSRPPVLSSQVNSFHAKPHPAGPLGAFSRDIYGCRESPASAQPIRGSGFLIVGRGFVLRSRLSLYSKVFFLRSYSYFTPRSGRRKAEEDEDEEAKLCALYSLVRGCSVCSSI